MAHARPEYAIIVAVIGVFLAIGVPALKRGQTFLGIAMVIAAFGATFWLALTLYRARR